MRVAVLLLLLAGVACGLCACRTTAVRSATVTAPPLAQAGRRSPPPEELGQARAFRATAERVGTCEAVGRCPPTARLRPSDGWAYREAWNRRPLASADAAWWRCACTQRARTKSKWLMGLTIVGVAVYGVGTWQWGDDIGHVADEGYFEENTDFGGADKAGHFMTGYIGTALFSWVHRAWGLSRREAAWRGALTSMIGMTMIEVGDSLSEDYGFSAGDLAFDALGCLAGYFHETSPWFHRTIDLRWEYWPTEYALDTGESPTGDYDGSAFLVAVNTGALVSRRPNALDLLDLQVGYQVRGYSTPGREQERWVFAGVGLNLANLLRRIGFKGAAFFDYYQAPYISLRLGYELNDGDTDLLYFR